MIEEVFYIINVVVLNSDLWIPNMFMGLDIC